MTLREWLLKRRLDKAHFREKSSSDDPYSRCRNCDHHKLIYLNPLDPDNSDAKYYCKYHSFLLGDRTDCICDKYYYDDSLIQELAAVIKSQHGQEE